MNRLRRLASALVVALVMMAMVAGSARAQVLKHVPPDAMVVVKFNNLKQTSDRLAALSEKFGLAQMNPAMGDPLGNFKQAIGANEGINEAGEAAIVVLANADFKPKVVVEGEEGNAPPEQRKADMLVLLPVSDYKAFLANYADAKTEGEITEVKLPSEPDKTAYVAHWGDYAAISTEDKTPLTKKPAAGLTPTGLAAKQLTEKDIAIYANMKPIRDRALPELKAQRGKIKEKLKEEMENKDAEASKKFGSLAETAVDQLLNLAEQFLEQAQAATLGIALTDSALKPTGVVEFDPKSKWGQSVAEIKNSGNAPLISGIPGDAKYLFVAGYQIDQQAMMKLLDNVMGPIEAEFAKMGDDGKPFQNYLTAFKASIQATRGGAGGWMAPEGKLGEDAIFQGAGVMKGDANKIIESQKQMFESQQAMMEVFGAKSGEFTISYTPNAKTIDGVSFNQFTSQIAPPAAGQDPDPQQMQAQQMMTWMYGKDGMSGYIGAVAPDTVVAVSGIDDAAISKVIAAAKANDTSYLKQEPVVAVSDQLPKERAFVMYVPLDNLAKTVVNYAGQFGMNMNVQIPENLQPLGFTAGTEGSAVRVDGVIPAETVQALISAGMQAYMNMQQGGPGAGGAGGL